MSLNDIQLKDFIVTEWYKDALLVSPDDPPPARRLPSDVTAPVVPTTQIPDAPSPVTQHALPSPPPTPPLPLLQSAPDQPAGDALSPYKVLGNNRRKITILVNARDAAFLPDHQLSFLSRILEACRMNLGDVAIVNHMTAPVNITALRQQLQSSVILLFGIEPMTIRLPINFPEFKIQPYDQCTYLAAPSLEHLVEASEESKLLKSKLWMCLKTLFEV